MNQQIPLDNARIAEDVHDDEIRDDGTNEVAPDLAYKRCAIANIAFWGVANASDRQWVLIDAGVMGTTALIAKAAAERFGPDSRPLAIVMTHGHFDHVGALQQLAERWDTPVYAHALEMPYLDGSASYPAADPSVGGGLMALMSRFYPRGPVNVAHRLQVLPADGSVPPMAGWKWIHTSGHTPGHVSLWREADRTIIAGDAFITTIQESAYAVATQKPEMHGPPMYYTQNWDQSRDSVQRLAALEPELVVTGHGPAMRGVEMRAALHLLAQNFDSVAVPDHGKYLESPTRAQDGSAYQPA